MPRRKNPPAAPSAPAAQADDDDALLDSHILANQVRVMQTKQLFEAAKQGRLDEVRSLLDLGLSPDETRPEKVCTPLTLAAQAGRVDVVRELLSRRADPNAHFRSNQMSTGPQPTPLFLATCKGTLSRGLLDPQPAPGWHERPHPLSVPSTMAEGAPRVRRGLLLR